jgi:hypothetical protein
MRYRVGQESAFDLKRLLVTACKEAGLEILTAWMTLEPDSTRLIEVQAEQPDWPYPGTLQIHIDGIVAADGTWPDSIGIMALAPSPTMQTTLFTVPTLNRNVPVSQVVSAVHETLEHQAEIIVGRERGEDGPWTFRDAEWRVLAAE